MDETISVKDRSIFVPALYRINGISLINEHWRSTRHLALANIKGISCTPPCFSFLGLTLDSVSIETAFSDFLLFDRFRILYPGNYNSSKQLEVL